MTGTDARPVRIAVIGAGTIAQAVHLPAIRRLHQSFDVRVVCDASAGRARAIAGQCGPDVRAVSAPVEAIGASDVEAVLVATPGSHAALTRLALAAGRHVLAEKPFSLTAREATEAAQLARRAGLILQVGYMKMFDPMVERAAQELASLSDPRLVRVTVLHPEDRHQIGHLRIRPYTDADPAALEAAEAEETAGVREALGDVPSTLAHLYRSVLLGSVVHQVSLLRALGLTPPAVFDHAERWPAAGGSEPSCLLATASIAPACRLLLSWNWLPVHPEYVEEVAVFAPDSRLHLDVAAPYLLEARSRLRIARASGELRTGADLSDGHDSGFVRQLAAFATSVRGGKPPRSDADGAAADVACLQALLLCLARGEGVPVGGEAGHRGPRGGDPGG